MIKYIGIVITGVLTSLFLFPFLISDGKRGEYSRWTAWYPEANAYIMQNESVSLRSRMVQWFAAHGQWWAVRLYHQVVMKWLYRMLYGR